MSSRDLWRVFPRDPGAKPGAPFSASFLPVQSGHGRFDLSRDRGASTWYFAESPEHAVAERLQDLRGRALFPEALFEAGHPLALVRADLLDELALVDLCDPAELTRWEIRPDRLASRDRDVTQEIAARLHADPEIAGLRWWSAFMGEWHTVALFSDRLSEGGLIFGDPGPLSLDSPAVLAAAEALGIEVE